MGRKTSFACGWEGFFSLDAVASNQAFSVKQPQKAVLISPGILSLEVLKALWPTLPSLSL